MNQSAAVWTAVTVVAAAMAGYAHLGSTLPRRADDSAPTPAGTFEWRRTGGPSSEEWKSIRRAGTTATAEFGPLGRRYRLAGTFFAYSDSATSGGSFCKAIVDNLETKEQLLLAEGDRIADVQVVRILRDRVVISSGGREEDLWLSFAGASAGNRPQDSVMPRTAASNPEETALETSAFGKRVGDQRWVLSRDSLMKYYQQLLDDPERIAALYMSMEPDYNQEGRIAGYRVNMQGEKDFFQATGLQNGDVVRRVNSMNMTSQARAEYFISEFAKNRVNAIVLDVQREGAEKKLIYLIR